MARMPADRWRFATAGLELLGILLVLRDLLFPLLP